MCEQVLFNTSQTSAIIGVPVETLRWWANTRWKGVNPNGRKLQPVRIGHRLYYHKDAINTFVEEVVRGEHADW